MEEKERKAGDTARSKSVSNLIQNKDIPYEEKLRLWKKGGKAAGDKRHKEASIRAAIKDMLALGVMDNEIVQLLEENGIVDNTHTGAIALAVIRKAERGDVEAARFVRDTIGEKPTESMNLGLTNQPVKALDITKLSDAELQALADREDVEELPEARE